VCFDEIHKLPKWKNILKGVFDETETHYQFIVTGSAKIDISKKAGDSLSGRYFTFHLFPLTLREVIGKPSLDQRKDETAENFVISKFDLSLKTDKALDDLLVYGGFPEPFLQHSQIFQNKWSSDYLDRVINEDIGSLTRIVDRDKLHDLYQLLPEMVGSPISENSLATHLETNPPTIKNYLKRLEDFYLSFRVIPYTRNIKRSLLKAAKWYLYDWTRITDTSKRFENYIAVELKTLLSLWSDSTGMDYALCYIRTKDKKETDFLILKQDKPWLLIEVKLSASPLEAHHYSTSQSLGHIPIVQLCHEKNIAAQHKNNVFHISASRFLA